MNRFTVVLIITLSLACLHGRADSTSDLDSARSRYETYLRQLIESRENGVATHKAEYASTLASLKRRAQSSGKLDILIAVTEEADRFKLEQDLFEDDIVSTPRILAETQQEFLERIRKQDHDRNQGILNLTRRYEGALVTYEQRFTAAGDIDAALAVKAERERVAASSLVTSAEFELAMAGEEAEDEPASELEEGGDDETAPIEDAPAPPMDTGIPSGVRVYKDGRAPATVFNMAFEKQALTSTDHSPLGSGLMISALCAGERDTVKLGSHHYKDAEESSLRLNLRMSPAAGVADNLMLLVEAYVNKPGQGRIVHELRRTKRVPISRLDASSLVVDFDPIKTSSTRVREWNRQWRFQGRDFYGYVVSVFTDGGKLMFQGVSARGLNEVAQPTLPGKRTEERLDEMRMEMEYARDVRETARVALMANPADEALREAYLLAIRNYQAAEMAYRGASSGQRR